MQYHDCKKVNLHVQHKYTSKHPELEKLANVKNVYTNII